MKFGHFILRKIFNFVALKCTKFNFGLGSAPNPAGGATQMFAPGGEHPRAASARRPISVKCEHKRESVSS